MDHQPHIVIHEQPKENGLRFRYATEGEKAGSITGEHSTAQHVTFPSIQLCNCTGQQALVVVSCVTADDPLHPRPHPHRLVGQDCERGAYRVNIKKTNNDIVPLTKIGIQCCKQKDIEKSLQERDSLASGKYISSENATGQQNSQIDLTTVRLCFQLFLYDGGLMKYYDMKVSNPIVDKKAVNDPVICRVSRSSGSVHGGDEVFLLCTGIKKDDIEVIFATPDKSWKAKGDFSPNDVHKQVAIVFRTPPYKDLKIDSHVEVNMYLYCPSKKQESASKKFMYYPDDPDPFEIENKGKRKRTIFTQFVDNYDIPSNLRQPTDFRAAGITLAANLASGIIRQHVPSQINAAESRSQLQDARSTGGFSRPTSVVANDAKDAATNVRPQFVTNQVQETPVLNYQPAAFNALNQPAAFNALNPDANAPQTSWFMSPATSQTDPFLQYNHPLSAMHPMRVDPNVDNLDFISEIGFAMKTEPGPAEDQSAEAKMHNVNDTCHTSFPDDLRSVEENDLLVLEDLQFQSGTNSQLNQGAVFGQAQPQSIPQVSVGAAVQHEPTSELFLTVEHQPFSSDMFAIVDGAQFNVDQDSTSNGLSELLQSIRELNKQSS